ncbi:MAG: nucleotidyltransferase family protein, partial [Candidatus Mariimomonas ferrooxydans]
MTSLLKGCTGVILAGGENRRLPVLKSFIEIDGEKIIERNLKIMKNLFNEVFIVTNQPEVYLYLGFPLSTLPQPSLT